MVREGLVRRGIRDQRVLDAMGAVPRERFVPEQFAGSAYEDRPLPIVAGQTISQPYVVALALEAAAVRPTDRVLEVGTGSGYAAAVLDELAAEVWTVERHGDLVVDASESLRAALHGNVHVRWGDGSLGWPEAAPFDVVLVSAAGEEVPAPLLEQLADDGRLVMPVGPADGRQELVLVHRVGSRLDREELGPVQFVPLLADRAARPAHTVGRSGRRATVVDSERSPAERLARSCEPFSSITGADLSGLVDRLSEARVVVLGPSTSGTSEFHQLCARIAQALVEQLGCRTIVIDADWPDVAALDAWCAGFEPIPDAPAPCTTFPSWRWRNQEFGSLLAWLRRRATRVGGSDPVRLVGLDVDAGDGVRAQVLDALDGCDPFSAAELRRRYATGVPWEHDASRRPEVSARAAAVLDGVVTAAVAATVERLAHPSGPGAFLDPATRDALVRSTPTSITGIVEAGPSWWSDRERRAATFLRSVVEHVEGPVVVWTHAVRAGDAGATDLDLGDAPSLGQACRAHLGDSAYLVGLGTGTGSVAAATSWGGHTEVLPLDPARAGSVEELLGASHLPACLLDLRATRQGRVGAELGGRRPQRVVGPVVGPETGDRQPVLRGVLPQQFDEFIWVGASSAVVPVAAPTDDTRADRFPPDR
jgi:protein-L-isoaspartate(D-aspartate) O-methyltransferase